MPDTTAARIGETFTGCRTGTIHQVNVSDGGVPKRPVPAAEVREQGLSGDRQRNRRVHGGPFRAVCLYSLEVIERLRAQGHPILPGAVGENLTVSGLDWSLVHPGVRLRVGETVLLEVTKFTAPCDTIAPAFIDGDFPRIAVQRAPFESRVYARVLTTGSVRAGDTIEIVT
jgi:MOSC domain-containing protein YiiM